MEIAYSVNDIPIRLTEERWEHIVSNKPYMYAYFIKLPATKMWLDYDSAADVLYVHFEDKPSSTHSEMTDEGVILDYQDEKLVGLTILDASQRG